MIPIAVIREQPELVLQGLKAKGESLDLDSLLTLDKEHRSYLNTLNELRAERNRTSEAIGQAKRNGKDASSAVQAMKKVASQIKDLEKRTSALAEQIHVRLLDIPNLPHETVPVGADERDNVVVRENGEKPTFEFEPKSHLALGAALNLFDFNRGAKLSGTGFPLYIDRGARLERALINFMLDHHTNKFGYTEIFPPFMTRGNSMVISGQLPKFEDDMYAIDKDDLYLIPTAEVPVTGIHQNEILDEEVLPVNYVAYSACFRREAGSYGKETRGFLRLHQFNKVELVKLVKPDTSYAELESLTAQAETVLQSLGLHYRVVALSSGDLSFSAAKCYDLEVWAPGEKAWLEVSSCSNFESFQARRGNIRYRRAKDKKVDFVHTLNGSGVATPRLLVALLETYQTQEGAVQIPEPLQPYLRLKELV